jgi:protein O-mannosyl-transferase
MRASNFTRKQWVAAIYFTLAIVTLLVYLPMLRHGFVNYDDPDYITGNSHVKAGLTWSGVAWAFQSGESSNWHPLTWISHMADCQVYGLKPAGHHLTNLLLHTANTLLLFILLNRLTGAPWRSAMVAALFAWHPLHVESVAWASERKDVLSAFFWMLTLLAYTRFVEESKVQSSKSKLYYCLALVLFACGLMSKPMVVTLPFVLLLLDFWPLQRMPAPEPKAKILWKLLLEKLPFFALSAAACVITFLVQRGALWSTASLPFSFRLANAVMSYVRYISNVFRPADLALIYPYPHHWPLADVVAAAVLLVLWSALFICCAKRFPYLAVGWFWYLGTLVPAIGLVQVGIQSMADRYTYLPSIGLFIAVVWGLNELLIRQPHKIEIAAIVASLALAGCLVVTTVQLTFWRNSVGLFRHTVRATTDNYAADDCLGKALENAGRTDAAALLYAEAVRIEPDYPMGQFDLGMIQLQQGKADEASNHLAIAAQLAPHNAVMQFDFGLYLLQHERPTEAVPYFRASLDAKPDFAEARQYLNQALNSTNTVPPPVNRSTP